MVRKWNDQNNAAIVMWILITIVPASLVTSWCCSAFAYHYPESFVPKTILIALGFIAAWVFFVVKAVRALPRLGEHWFACASAGAIVGQGISDNIHQFSNHTGFAYNLTHTVVRCAMITIIFIFAAAFSKAQPAESRLK